MECLPISFTNLALAGTFWRLPGACLAWLGLPWQAVKEGFGLHNGLTGETKEGFGNATI